MPRNRLFNRKKLISKGRSDAISGEIKEPKVRLELLKLKLNRKWNKSWNLYFVLTVEDPLNSSLMYIAEYPDANAPYPDFDLTKRSNNTIPFAPSGSEADGLQVFESRMPKDRQISVRLNLVRSKGKTRKRSAVIERGAIFMDDIAEVLKLEKIPNFWVKAGVLSNKAVGKVSHMIAETKDKDLGFVSLDERFEENCPKILCRDNQLISGEATLYWRWIIE
ncbi:hypothetical protein D8Y20_11485 [Mariprofundus sp. EBB-1]|uniref:hypothetical protein n=1 Tax=Mariprofundus sp. EBB-1 TaxID=2650971 RepID=UPI000EF273BC|nr:hypothetical protein [Mariprofundus sp. EBB-1]RLL50651.1 hypothetical protein D8Y20_11485 [Mariprofundus sp. EBB-1]